MIPWKTKCLLTDYILFGLNTLLIVLSGLDFAIAVIRFNRGEILSGILFIFWGLWFFYRTIRNYKSLLKEIREDRNGT